MNSIGPPCLFPDDASPRRHIQLTGGASYGDQRLGGAAMLGLHNREIQEDCQWRTVVIFSCDLGGPLRQRPNGAAAKYYNTPYGIPLLYDRRGKPVRRYMESEASSWPCFDRHNHEPSFSPVAHPTLRQLSHQDESTVQRLTNAGIAPKDIRSYLRINSDTLAT
jgi:hypothetical protein